MADKHRRHVWMDDEHWEWLHERFHDNIGVSNAIRMIIQKFKSAIEAKASAAARTTADLAKELEQEGRQ